MKINWRIAAGVIFIIVVGIWMLDSLRLRDYAGGNLNVGIGHGVVTLTNQTDQPIAAQLVSTGSRSFAVSSGVEGLSGTSVRAGTGSATTQTFAFDVPPGVSMFAVPRGTGVSLVTNTSAPLEVTVETQSAGEAQTVRAAGIIVMLLAAYFIYRTVREDQRIAKRRQAIAVDAAKPVVPVTTAAGGANVGRDGRAYSDS